MALLGQSLSAQHSRQMSGVLLAGHVLPAHGSLLTCKEWGIQHLVFCGAAWILRGSGGTLLPAYTCHDQELNSSPTMLTMVPEENL